MRATLLTCTVLLLISFPVVTAGQEPQGAVPAVTSAESADTGPVAVPPASEKAMRYYRSGNVLWVIDVALGLLIPSLFVFTGFSARLRDVARRVGRNWFSTLVVFFVLFSLITFVIGLPWAYYTEFVRQHDYGLSNQTFAKWFGDSVKGLLVGLIIGALFLWVPFLLLKKSPQRWWLYTSVLMVPFLLLMLVIGPIWVDPLFNEFGPMKDRPLEQQILALADRAGIEGSRVYEVNKSVDTKAVNAYVAGLFETKRIVLWDTIIAKLTPRELLTVMGHEMGHYVLGHVPKSVAFFSLLILATLYLAHRTAGFFFSRFAPRMGFTSLADIAALPLLMLLTNIFSFIIVPVGLAYSRHNEHEADRFALEVTRDNHAFATAFVKLQTENLGNPRPGWIYVLWRSGHRTIGQRIDFANAYKPWEKGEPLRYERLFRAAYLMPPTP
ncbi:MAG TPA: M48 family metallopeptidase [Vicinamibacteria bacterium]|nr:M48 family metallopeptidase [Vicinamibacteria bacterium]